MGLYEDEMSCYVQHTWHGIVPGTCHILLDMSLAKETKYTQRKVL